MPAPPKSTSFKGNTRRKTSKSAKSTATRSDATQKEASKEDIKFKWAKEIWLPIILAIVSAGLAVLLPLIISFFAHAPTPVQSTTPTVVSLKPERIQLQDDYYHFGDVENTAVMSDGQVIDRLYFSHPAPQNNPFVKEFVLSQLQTSATLHLTARSIDPNEKKSPIKIFFNGYQADFLNRYFAEETMTEASVSIPVDVSLLREGKNVFQIFVEPTNLDIVPNIEDIEFWNVYLELTP